MICLCIGCWRESHITILINAVNLRWRHLRIVSVLMHLSIWHSWTHYATLMKRTSLSNDGRVRKLLIRADSFGANSVLLLVRWLSLKIELKRHTFDRPWLSTVTLVASTL